MTIDIQISDRLLTEFERQQKYLAQQALRLIQSDKRLVDAATLAGISRFVLHRRIDQHSAKFRAAVRS